MISPRKLLTDIDRTGEESLDGFFMSDANKVKFLHRKE
jgi:hypothetical protein